MQPEPRMAWRVARWVILIAGTVLAVATLLGQEASARSLMIGHAVPVGPFASLTQTADHVDILAPVEVPTITVPLYNVNTHETMLLALPRDGVLNEEQATRVAKFFRCVRTQKTHIMAPQVLAMLADLSEKFPGRQIDIVSGFRSKRYARPNSRHRHGRAIDLRVRGISAKRLSSYLWTQHTVEAGIGFYSGQRFVHMDYRPDHKALAWTQKRMNDPNKYHPWWAIKIRRLQRKAAAETLRKFRIAVVDSMFNLRQRLAGFVSPKILPVALVRSAVASAQRILHTFDHQLRSPTGLVFQATAKPSQRDRTARRRAGRLALQGR